MRITADAVALGEGAGAEVQPLSFSAGTGTPIVIAVETDERPQLLSLLLGGRVKPTAGRVLIDEADDAAALRRHVALVDTPFASEPGAGLRLATVVAEELSFARRPAGRAAVRQVLGEHGLGDRGDVRMSTLPAADRIRLLTELSLLRAGVRGVVITSPDRHGGDPREWYPTLEAIAERGVVVVIVTDLPTAAVLRGLGALDGAAEPAQPAEGGSPVEPAQPAEPAMPSELDESEEDR